MALAPGVRLGPYAIVSALGAGGMGEVYKSTDTRLDRTVAIKVLPAHVAADPDLRQPFEREAKTISSRLVLNTTLLFDAAHEGLVVRRRLGRVVAPDQRQPDHYCWR